MSGGRKEASSGASPEGSLRGAFGPGPAAQTTSPQGRAPRGLADKLLDEML